MPSEARQKKIMEKLNRAQKCSILGPQNLGSGGAWAPRPPPGSAPDIKTSHLTMQPPQRPIAITQYEFSGTTKFSVKRNIQNIPSEVYRTDMFKCP